jgi:putative ABC transport system ATP-binding protein
MPPIIQVHDVSKIYRIGKVEVPAVRGVSFDVERGEFVSIVGAAGNRRSSTFWAGSHARLAATY